MNARREFLLALFRQLEAQGVPYCVARNYDQIYDDTTSDVDLMVEPAEFDQLKHCLDAAAAASRHTLVLQARYVNFSYVFWHRTDGFLRIDIETEVRWRIFPILSAKAVVGLRRKYGEFYVPHPRHESVILLAASLWRGSVSERYQGQLARLYSQFKDPEELRRTLCATFGKTGSALTDYQSRLASTKPAATALLQSAKRSLIAHAIRTAPARRTLAQYLRVDIQRVWERLRKPPGLSLLFTSSAPAPPDINGLSTRMEALYPSKKTTMRAFDFSGIDAPSARIGFRMRLERLRTLLKGGLFIRSCQVKNDALLSNLLTTHTKFIYPSREFICVRNSGGEVVLAHVDSGFMAESKSSSQTASPEEQIIELVAGMLEKASRLQPRPALRGLFLVLLGLDGSGKTTVARELCCLARESDRFRKVRYFHWRPKFAQTVFPLSATANVPRKLPQEPNLARSVSSVLRLLKNLLLTRLAWSFRVNNLLNHQTLIVMDRYYYNYYLDPVSVRYYGPPWLLDKLRSAFPKPDLVVVLKAPAATLLARKQELSEEEIQRQTLQLEHLDLDAADSLIIDATQPASDIALTIMKKIAEPTLPSSGLVQEKDMRHESVEA